MLNIARQSFLIIEMQTAPSSLVIGSSIIIFPTGTHAALGSMGPCNAANCFRSRLSGIRHSEC